MSRARRWILATVGVVVLVAAAGSLAAQRIWTLLHTPYRGFSGDEVYVEIPPGLGGGAILERLRTAGVLPETRWTRLWLVRGMGDPRLAAGEYRFHGAATPIQVLEQLRRGEIALFSATVVEGLTLQETAAALAEAGVADRPSLVAAFTSARARALVADLDPAAADLEGYLFPDTYRFPRKVSADEVAATLAGAFRRRFSAEIRPLLPPTADPRQVVTLASLVEKEAKLDSERPVIAAVYANRLRLGMTLGADPTIIYGLKLAGVWDGNLRRVHLETDGPYNSYRRTGLPPTPICSPGLASLAAAAAPADSDVLYFVSRNDGSHVFTRTLAEHSREVERWQRRYWRERRARTGDASAGSAKANAD
ncbi:MAG: endolytic transglycosylase MltG [Holophagales bacterium]|nr:MAG: endolytic transglycosylase MltG [Holophagales bacterium]